MASVMADTAYQSVASGTEPKERRLLRSSRRNWLLSGLCSFFLLFAECAQSVQLIAHESVPVTQLSLKELRAIYTMRMDHWDQGLRIQVFTLPQRNEVYQRFCKSVLQVLPHQLQATWYRLVFSGMGRAPVEVGDEQAMIEQVRTTPGAIGYLEKDYALSDEQQIKVIQLQLE